MARVVVPLYSVSCFIENIGKPCCSFYCVVYYVCKNWRPYNFISISRSVDKIFVMYILPSVCRRLRSFSELFYEQYIAPFVFRVSITLGDYNNLMIIMMISTKLLILRRTYITVIKVTISGVANRICYIWHWIMMTLVQGTYHIMPQRQATVCVDVLPPHGVGTSQAPCWLQWFVCTNQIHQTENHKQLINQSTQIWYFYKLTTPFSIAYETFATQTQYNDINWNCRVQCASIGLVISKCSRLPQHSPWERGFVELII